MSRLPPIDPSDMTALQKKLYDEIAGPRGGAVGGPFAVWMRRPEIAARANEFGNALRLNGTLERRLFELAVLVIARYWSAQYEWYVHEAAARKVGLEDAIIEAIRHGRTPTFAGGSDELVYDFVRELCETRTVGEHTFARATAALGTEVLIELVTVIGFYTIAAMVINVFDAPVPDGACPLPAMPS